MRRCDPSFTTHQTNRLIALNRHLAALEYACLQRARHLVEHYKWLTGGAVDWSQGQDFELESEVQYYRPLTPAESQDEANSHDGLILQCDFITTPPLKWYFLNPTAKRAAQLFESMSFNWNEGVEGIEGLSDQRICWAFHDLHDHHGLTWEQILQIETIWVDVRAVHQLITELGTPAVPSFASAWGSAVDRSCAGQ